MPTAAELKTEGNSLFIQKKWDEAIEKYAQAVALEPNFKEAWFNQAVCHSKLAHTERALELLEKALQIDPTYLNALRLKGQILASQEKYREALSVAEAALTTDPDNISLHHLRERCLGTLGATVFFNIIDLKFTKENEVKILEFGEGMNSGFSGFDQLYPESPMFERFLATLKEFKLPYFLNGRPLLRAFQDSFQVDRWKKPSDLPFDPADLSSYRGIYGGRQTRPTPKEVLLLNGQGITDLLFDDKRFMHQTLFEGAMKKYRPLCEIVSKNPDLETMDKLLENFKGSSYVVIKDGAGSNGNAVIFVPLKSLKKCFQLLNQLSRSGVIDKPRASHVIQELEELLDSRDDAMKLFHSYMACDPEFIIEAPVHSKPLFSKGQNYDATMRVAFVAYRDQGKISIQYLGSYWKLPAAPMGSEVSAKSMLSSYKSHSVQSEKVAPKDEEAVYQQLNLCLPTLLNRGLNCDVVEYVNQATEKGKDALFYLCTRVGVCYGTKGFFNFAMHYIERAITEKPEDDEGPHFKAQLLNYMGRHKEAKNIFERLLAKSPSGIGSYKDLADSYYFLGEYQRAKATLDEGISRGLSVQMLSNGSYFFNHTIGRIAQAVEWTPPLPEKSAKVEAKPVAIGALDLKLAGNTLFAEKKWAEAIEKYAQAVALDPTFKEAWFNQAVCQVKLGQIALAHSCLDHALQLDPDYVKAIEFKAKISMPNTASDSAACAP